MKNISVNYKLEKNSKEHIFLKSFYSSLNVILWISIIPIYANLYFFNFFFNNKKNSYQKLVLMIIVLEFNRFLTYQINLLILSLDLE